MTQISISVTCALTLPRLGRGTTTQNYRALFARIDSGGPGVPLMVSLPADGVVRLVARL